MIKNIILYKYRKQGDLRILVPEIHIRQNTKEKFPCPIIYILLTPFLPNSGILSSEAWLFNFKLYI